MKRKGKQSIGISVDTMLHPEDASPVHTQNVGYGTQERYPIETRKQCVLAMLSTDRDHPTCAAARAAAYNVLGKTVNVSTLHDWLQQYRDEITASLPALPDRVETAAAAVNTVVKSYLDIRSKLMAHLASDETINEMNGQQTAVSIGIMEDKIERLTAISPENAQLMGRFIAKCQQYGVDHKATLDEIMTRMDTFYRPKLGAIIDVQPKLHAGSDNDDSGDNPG